MLLIKIEWVLRVDTKTSNLQTGVDTGLLPFSGESPASWGCRWSCRSLELQSWPVQPPPSFQTRWKVTWSAARPDAARCRWTSWPACSMLDQLVSCFVQIINKYIRYLRLTARTRAILWPLEVEGTQLVAKRVEQRVFHELDHVSSVLLGRLFPQLNFCPCL